MSDKINLAKECICPRFKHSDTVISRKEGHLIRRCHACRRLLRIPNTFWDGVKIQDAFLEKTKTKQ